MSERKNYVCVCGCVGVCVCVCTFGALRDRRMLERGDYFSLFNTILHDG